MIYNNPILRGFNPDPSICRVDDDYYLVTSSFEYFPGIPIYHSTDLVNWTQIGNCIERPEQLPLEQAKSSGGVWAPTIRYEAGVFYVTATFSSQGNFIVTSTNPATGWSDPMWTDFSGIDPSIFFENGEMYYCANDIGVRYQRFQSEGISLAKMNKETGKVIGEIKRIWNGNGGGWLEAPHIYHIGEYYYIIAAEGGTNHGHHEIAGRSRNIWGPYESCPDNPILTNRNDCSKQISCTGHGDIVEDANGNWWMVHLGTRDFQNMTHLGRETFLMPILWKKDGWFQVGEKRMSLLEVDNAPLWTEQQEITEWSTTFSSADMEKQWLFRRIPVTENYVRENGMLTLKPTTVKLSDCIGSPTFLALRPLDLHFSAQTEFEFEPERNGDCAGMVVYLNENFYYRIYKKRENDRDYIIFERRMGDVNVIEYHEAIGKGTLTMKIKTDSRKYYFYYTLDSKEIEAGSGTVKYLSTNIAEKCFTGNLVGLFTECDRHTSARLKVHSYKMKI